MAKTVAFEIDADLCELTVESGTLFLGERAPIVFAGYTPADGNTLFVSLFDEDRVTPLADNAARADTLDLRCEALRKSFGDCKTARVFYATVIERASDGSWVGQVLAAGRVRVEWSPVVFDAVSGRPATLKGDAGATGAALTWDMLTDAQKASLRGADGADGATGPVGPQGPRGPQGIQGVAGPQGAAGADGADGSDGADGVSPVVTVTDVIGGHRVTIVDASGAKAFTVLDGSTGAQGPQGVQGIQGLPGIQGEKGDAGDPSHALEGERMRNSPSQRQMIVALKKIWTALGGTIVCLLLCLSCLAVTRDTEWQDVPPETRLGTVVDLAPLSSDSSIATLSSVASNLAAHASSTANPHKVTAAQAGAVPTTRKINGKALSSDVTLGAADVGAVSNLDGAIGVSGGDAINGVTLTLKGSSNGGGSSLKVNSGSFDGLATQARLEVGSSGQTVTIESGNDIKLSDASITVGLPGSNLVIKHGSIELNDASGETVDIVGLSKGAVQRGDLYTFIGQGVPSRYNKTPNGEGGAAIGKDAPFNGDRTITLGSVASLDSLYLGDTNLQTLVDAALDAKQDRPAATATADALSLRADGAAISVSVAASGTLSASLEGWTDGQAQTALISIAPGASVAAAVSLVGYGSWPTNRFVASCVRVGPRVYVTPITALAE